MSLLRIGASAELVSKLGLSVEGSWTVGNLLNAKLAGAAEVGVNARLEAGAALMMTPAGPMASVTANASAFAGLKAEGSAQLNLFKSQYANAYSLSAKVRAAANLGVGATAGATAAIGSAGVKLHTTLGVTLGVGTEVGWEGSVNAMATKAYALELAARAMSRFDQSKGQYLDSQAMAIGIESRLYELAQRMDSRIATLPASWMRCSWLSVKTGFAYRRVQSIRIRRLVVVPWLKLLMMLSARSGSMKMGSLLFLSEQASVMTNSNSLPACYKITP